MRKPTTARAPSTNLRPRCLPFTATLKLVHLGYRLGDLVVVVQPYKLRLSRWPAEDQRGCGVDTRGLRLGLGSLELLGYRTSFQVGAPLAHVESRRVLGLALKELVRHV